LHKSNIEQQHRPILDQPPEGLELRTGRQGHPDGSHRAHQAGEEATKGAI
jgi:hypothetical protein